MMHFPPYHGRGLVVCLSVFPSFQDSYSSCISCWAHLYRIICAAMGVGPDLRITPQTPLQEQDKYCPTNVTIAATAAGSWQLKSRREPSSKTTGRSISAAAPTKAMRPCRQFAMLFLSVQALSGSSDFDNLVEVGFRLRDEFPGAQTLPNSPCLARDAQEAIQIPILKAWGTAAPTCCELPVQLQHLRPRHESQSWRQLRRITVPCERHKF